MITKGTAEYKKAQDMANWIAMQASCPNTMSNHTTYEAVVEKFGRFISKVAKLDGFAGEVAKTVEASTLRAKGVVAYMSSKQSWIIACACVENGIEY